MTDYMKVAINILGSVFILGGFVIGIASFRDSTVNTTVEYQVLNDSLNIPSNLTAQFDTVGTLLGVGILLYIVNRFS